MRGLPSSSATITRKASDGRIASSHTKMEMETQQQTEQALAKEAAISSDILILVVSRSTLVIPDELVCDSRDIT